MSANFYSAMSPTIGVTAATIANWEKGDTEPSVGCTPAIIKFLGYAPFAEPMILEERMRAYRHQHGLSIKAAALRAGVNESSWGRWERAGLIPWERYRTLVDEFLESGAVVGADYLLVP